MRPCSSVETSDMGLVSMLLHAHLLNLVVKFTNLTGDCYVSHQTHLISGALQSFQEIYILDMLTRVEV